MGTELNDTITGDANLNILQGRYGSDRINGGPGPDLLFGGAVPVGGANGAQDIFTVAPGQGPDIIGDFTRGEDQLEIVGIAQSDFDANGNNVIDQNDPLTPVSGGHLVIRFDDLNLDLLRVTQLDVGLDVLFV